MLETTTHFSGSIFVKIKENELDEGENELWVTERFENALEVWYHF